MIRKLALTVWMVLYAGLAQAAYQLNLQAPDSAIAQEIYDLHTIINWICVVIFVVVFGFMFYAIFKHRKSLGHEAAQFHENVTVEIVWTIIPFLILLVMAWPATKTIIAIKDTTNPDMTIKATGYQWKWGYDYLQGEGQGISFFSALSTPREQIDNEAPKGEHYLLEVDNPLVVPVGKKVRILATAGDVIHAFWVPAFGIKQDAIPGFVRDTWFKADNPGVFRGQCAELCGKEHGFMPIVVEVKTAEDYSKWVADQKSKTQVAEAGSGKTLTLDELKAQGEKVFSVNCAVCHQANGKGIPGAFPALDGSPIVTGPLAAHLDRVLNGKTGTAMPAFKIQTQLSDLDIAAVITYERNSWGNKAGDAVQSAQVTAARK